MDAKSLLILLLLVALAALGYFYYESQQSVVRIDAPGIKVDVK